MPEYLIVDPEEKVGVFRVLESGHYREAHRVAWGAAVTLLGERISISIG